MKPHQQSALHIPLYKIWVTWPSHLKPHQDSEFTWPGRSRGSSPITPNCSLLSSICNLVDAPQLLPERSWLGERERGGIPRMTDWENCSSDWVAGITCLCVGGAGGGNDAKILWRVSENHESKSKVRSISIFFSHLTFHWRPLSLLLNQ